MTKKPRNIEIDYPIHFTKNLHRLKKMRHTYKNYNNKN
jgi:hypothetical protein